MAAAVQPWNVSSLAQAAGLAALQEGEFLQKTRTLIFKERSFMAAELRKLGFWVSDSAANYLLFQGPKGLDQALKQKKISIRSCSNYYGLTDGWYRTAVRLPEENRALLEAIRDCL